MNTSVSTHEFEISDMLRSGLEIVPTPVWLIHGAENLILFANKAAQTLQEKYQINGYLPIIAGAAIQRNGFSASFCSLRTSVADVFGQLKFEPTETEGSPIYWMHFSPIGLRNKEGSWRSLTPGQSGKLLDSPGETMLEFDRNHHFLPFKKERNTKNIELLTPTQVDHFQQIVEHAYQNGSNNFTSNKNQQISVWPIYAQAGWVGSTLRISPTYLPTSNHGQDTEYQEIIKRYSDLFEQVKTGLVLLYQEELGSPKTLKFYSCNKAALEIFGPYAGNFQGKFANELFPSEITFDAEAIYHQIMMEQKEVVLTEVESHHPEAGTHYWDIRFAALPGKFVGIAFNQVTRRVVARRQNDLFNQVMQYSNDAVFVVSPEEGQIFSSNKRAQIRYLYDEEAIQKLKLWEFCTMATNGIEDWHRLMKELKAEGKLIKTTRHTKKDGSSFPVEISFRYTEIEQQAYVIANARDLSTLEAQSERLKESEAKYRNFVERINEGLILTDMKERILYVNQRTCGILGYEENELIGRSTLELTYDEEGKNTIMGKIANRLSGTSEQYELGLQRKNGDKLWVMVTGAPYEEADGQINGSIAIITDITDRKKAELQLRQTNAELDSFVYKASHDLKGPLASIIGVVNIAKDRIRDPESLTFFDLILKSASKLDNILMELIDVTRMNKAKIEPAEVNIHKLVEEILQSLQHNPEREKVEVNVDISPSLTLSTDIKLIRSILQNLIVNSINYRDPAKATSKVQIRGEVLPSGVQIEVSDNGKGIPERLKSRIFEMFFRGDTTSKGTGLGLYIVKNSVNRLGGKLSFTSEEGVGTTFVLQLSAFDPHSVSP
ncbi:MAG: PAS domain S-box protein [Bacteroidota bacterium]